MKLKFSPENKGGPLLLATIFACLIAGGLIPFTLRPPTDVNFFNMFFGAFMVVFLGPFLGLPGLALAYVILRRLKKPPGILACLLWGAAIGSVVAFSYMFIWVNIGLKWVALLMFATGPLAGLIYYFLTKDNNTTSA